MKDDNHLYFFLYCNYLFRTFRVFDQNHQLCLTEQKVASTNGIWDFTTSNILSGVSRCQSNRSYVNDLI